MDNNVLTEAQVAEKIKELKDKIKNARELGKKKVENITGWSKDQLSKLKSSYEKSLTKVKTAEARKALKDSYLKKANELRATTVQKLGTVKKSTEDAVKKYGDDIAKFAKTPKGKIAVGAAAATAAVAGGAYAYKKMKGKKKVKESRTINKSLSEQGEAGIPATMALQKTGTVVQRIKNFLGMYASKVNAIKAEYAKKIAGAADAATKAKYVQQMRDSLTNLSAKKMDYLAKLRNPKVLAGLAAAGAVGAGAAYGYKKMKGKQNEAFNNFLLKVALGTTIAEMTELDKDTRLTLLEYVEGADKHQLLNLIIDGGIDEIISSKKKTLLESAVADKKKFFVFEEVRPFIDLL